MGSAVITVVGGIAAGGDGGYRHGLAALAVGLIMLGAVASPAAASSLHRLASGTVAFSSDGTRFVAWQNRGDEQIVVFDALTRRRRSITPPAGCRLHDEAESGEPVISAAAGRFLLECEEGDAQALLDVRTGKTILMPKKTNGTSDWNQVGSRYVMVVNVIYDNATGASTRLDRTADLDMRPERRPTASARRCAAWSSTIPGTGFIQRLRVPRRAVCPKLGEAR